MAQWARIALAVGLIWDAGCIANVGEFEGDGGSNNEDPLDPISGGVNTRVSVLADAGRPVDIMPIDRLEQIASRLPNIANPELKAILEDPDTMWYDRLSIIPGYQDSFGDNVITPIGMRPNTIDSNLIDLAVPGGHDWIFQKDGLFHFPFGRTGDLTGDSFLVNFWRLPRNSQGDLAPVAWWQRDPNEVTHRVEWMFPADTILGEIQFIIDDDGNWFPFEIRTRKRTTTSWTIDVFRPFPTANDFALSLEAKRSENSQWQNSGEIEALVSHLRDQRTLRAASLGSPEFPGTFPTIDGAEDVLPPVSDTRILKELLLETPFRSAKGKVWKQDGALIAHAATTNADFQIVPKGYDGGFMEVSDEACSTCHRDAGRPFRDWYRPILAYGELWGEDESFTWHPFETSNFVNSNGDVVDFNYDNREMRSDFVNAGVLERYNPSTHTSNRYKTLPGEWKNYSY